MSAAETERLMTALAGQRLPAQMSVVWTGAQVVIYVLANDGTMWTWVDDRWARVTSLPQPK